MAIAPWYHYPDQPRYETRHATVIGGGLAGSSVASALAARGWEVTIIERHENLSQEASGNPSGVVMPSISRDNNPASQFSYAAFQFALDHFHKLETRAESAFFNPVGVVQLNPKAASYVDALDTYYSALRARHLNPEQLAGVIGYLHASEALHFPTAGWLNPNALCRSQIEAQRMGIQVIASREAVHLQRLQDGWLVFNKKQALIKSPVVIIANGTDANRFPQTAPLPIIPVRGQISFISSAAFTIPIRKVICSNLGYLIPDRQETATIGATYERGSLDSHVRASSHGQNLFKLKSLNLLKNFDEDHIVGGRAAVRATTSDRLPLVGAVPEFASYMHRYRDLHHGRAVGKYPHPAYYEGLYLAAGFGSRGITHCPYSGELLARLIDGKLLKGERQLLALLHPARFLIRQLKKQPEKTAGTALMEEG